MRRVFLFTAILLFLCACGSPKETTEAVLPEASEQMIDEEPTAVAIPTKTTCPTLAPTEDIWTAPLTQLPIFDGGKDDLPKEYIYLPTYCEQIHVLPPSAEYGVRYGWATKEEIQMDKFLQISRIELSIDGNPVKYDGMTENVFYEDLSAFAVWFYKIIGTLDLGLHSIEQKIVFNEEYSDGYENYGPDTEIVEITEKCEFIIQEIE